MHKVYVLLSGGVDSTTTLAIARAEFPNDEIECVSVDYGQRHKKEMQCAKSQSECWGAAYSIIEARGVLEGMLLDKGEKNEVIPEVSYAELPIGISPTYMSFRNGFMLSLLAARAQAWVMSQEKAQQKFFDEKVAPHPGKGMAWDEFTATIYLGVHADDGVNWAYPDCTPEFIGPMSAAIYTGTYNKVRVRAPLLYLTKPAVVREGSRLGVDYANTWSCYKGDEQHCGLCPTCRSRKDAFEQNGLADPTEYAA